MEIFVTLTVLLIVVIIAVKSNRIENDDLKMTSNPLLSQIEEHDKRYSVSRERNSFKEQKEQILKRLENYSENSSSSNKKSNSSSKNKEVGFKIDLLQMLEETSNSDEKINKKNNAKLDSSSVIETYFDNYEKIEMKKSIENSRQIHAFKKEIINLIDFTVFKVENDRVRTNFKILITNNSNVFLKTIYFDIKFYDADEHLKNVESGRIHNINPGEESVKVIHLIPRVDDFEKYSLKISDVNV